MIEHVSLRCRDPKMSRAFYEKVLAPLGYFLNMEFGDSFGFMEGGHTSFWVTKGRIGTPAHIAFRARTRKAVDAFYAAAIEAGAKDNGPPGLRADYSEDYYAAFVLDRDGHNIEAVSFQRAKRATRSAAAR